jgi:pyrroloquinoline quinone biosynthesis protein B
LNASPDLRSQIEATSWLQPREGLRSSPIAGVVLTGGDVDAIAGLLHLRERIELAGASGACGLAVVAFAVPGKVPLYLETTGQDPGLSEEGDAVASSGNTTRRTQSGASTSKIGFAAMIARTREGP